MLCLPAIIKYWFGTVLPIYFVAAHSKLLACCTMAAVSARTTALSHVAQCSRSERVAVRSPLFRQLELCPRRCCVAGVGVEPSASSSSAPLTAAACKALRSGEQHPNIAQSASGNATSPSGIDEAPYTRGGIVSTSGTRTAAQCAPKLAPGSGGAVLLGVAALAAVLCTAGLIMPQPSDASELLSGSVLDLYTSFLAHIEELGPWGMIIFVATVTICEMVPLLPTQPLSLSGGLIFGVEKGALLVLLGGTLAAVNAFAISRGFGGTLVRKMVDVELGSGSQSTKKGGVAAKLAEVQLAIESGGFWNQFWAITFLRLTPVVPFSASNYLLGLTPVQPAAFVLGTVTGSAFWSVAYASLGGASRNLLKSGVDPELLLTDLAEKASRYSETAGVVFAAAGAVAALYFGGTAILQKRRNNVPAVATSSLDGANEDVGGTDDAVGTQYEQPQKSLLRQKAKRDTAQADKEAALHQGR